MTQKFTVSYTSLRETVPQPASPVFLEPAYVLFKATRDGKITLKDTYGSSRDFIIIEVRHELDAKGNHIGFALFVSL